MLRGEEVIIPCILGPGCFGFSESDEVDDDDFNATILMMVKIKTK